MESCSIIKFEITIHSFPRRRRGEEEKKGEEERSPWNYSPPFETPVFGLCSPVCTHRTTEQIES